LNEDAVAVSEGEKGKHPRYCFTYRGEPIQWGVCNTGWLEAVKKAELTDFRFHDLRHTWASWHRQAGTSCDELKELEVARDGGPLREVRHRGPGGRRFAHRSMQA